MIKKLNKYQLLLLLILLLSVLFRFYKFYQYQYFSGDEEVLTATNRHIIWDLSPSFIVQNASLAFGMGPFYHYLLVPFYFLTKFDLTNLQILASIIGILSTYLVFLSGKEIGGKKLGLIASFFYASSFLISVFDRRLYFLTLNPALTGLTIYSLAKIIKKNFRYIPLLFIPIGFAFHSHASLLVLVFTIISSYIFLKIPLKKKYLFQGLLIFFLFLSPLLMAEVKYNRTVSKSIQTFFERSLNPGSLSQKTDIYSPMDFFNVLTSTFFTAPSKFVENQFCYCNPPLPLFSPLAQFFVACLLLISFLMQVKRKPGMEKRLEWILWLALLSLFFSIFIYNQVFQAFLFQHYYTVIFPVTIILLTKPLLQLEKKLPRVFWFCLIIYLGLNLNTLFKSSVKYPLIEKINLVNKTATVIGDKEFSILYPGPIQQEDPELTVYFYKEDSKPDHNNNVLDSYSFKDLRVDILDNLQF